MRSSSPNRERRDEEAGRQALSRDLRLAALLKLDAPEDEILPWHKVEALVASAPPVKATVFALFERSFTAVPRQLRYALATLLLMGLGGGVLSVTPAQSDFVGTIVVTELPAAFAVGSPAFNEVEAAAQSKFAKLALPQSQIYIKVGPGIGRDQLAIAMVGADRRQAEGLYNELRADYPALAAFKADYAPIASDRYSSMLAQLISGVTRQAGVSPLDDNALKLYVLKALSDAGFKDIKIEIVRREDGTTCIEVDARMSIAVKGRVQEEMMDSERYKRLLGSEAYRQLLSELGSER